MKACLKEINQLCLDFFVLKFMAIFFKFKKFDPNLKQIINLFNYFI